MHSKRSGFSVNRRRSRFESTVGVRTPGLPGSQIIIQPPDLTNDIKKASKEDFTKILTDQNAVKNTFTALKNRLKLEIA